MRGKFPFSYVSVLEERAYEKLTLPRLFQVANVENRQLSRNAGGDINTVPIGQAVVCQVVLPGPLRPNVLFLSMNFSSSVSFTEEHFKLTDHTGVRETATELKFEGRSCSATEVSLPHDLPTPFSTSIM